MWKSILPLNDTYIFQNAYLGVCYSIAEGTEIEIGNMTQQYGPFVHFKVHPVSSVSQLEEVIKALTK